MVSFTVQLEIRRVRRPDRVGHGVVGDVGGDSWEEINFQEAGTIAGQNYGWDWLEASHCYPAGIEECPRQQVGVLPVAEYQHGDDGCAVIGFGAHEPGGSEPWRGTSPRATLVRRRKRDFGNAGAAQGRAAQRP